MAMIIVTPVGVPIVIPIGRMLSSGMVQLNPGENSVGCF
jgi:hypothetical protein